MEVLFMKFIKKMSAVILSVILSILVYSLPVSAETIYDELYYVVYDQDGNFVKDGIILPSSSTGTPRYTWDSSITLDNGWTTSFIMPGPRTFLIPDDTTVRFHYSLDKTAKIQYVFYKDDTATTAYPTTWKYGFVTAIGATLTRLTDETAYYFVGITNYSDDAITISDVSFT